jgi:hypothetical protein
LVLTGNPRRAKQAMNISISFRILSIRSGFSWKMEKKNSLIAWIGGLHKDIKFILKFILV